jgi:TolB-like protein
MMIVDRLPLTLNSIIAYNPSMGMVRTKLAIILVGFAVIFLLNACGTGDDGRLVFIERDPGVVREDPGQIQISPETTSNRVELAESSQQVIKLSVLPFQNTSNQSEFDYLLEMIQDGVEEKLADYDRSFDASIYDQSEYYRTVAAIGRGSSDGVDRYVADLIRERDKSDVILFGYIRIVEGEVIIEPYIITGEDFEMIPLEKLPVKLNELFVSLNQFIENMINEIIEKYQV